MTTERICSIDFFRVFLILLMVAYHAFAPFCGAWHEVLGTEHSCHLLFIVDRYFYFGMLESFVFISGYLYQAGQKKRQIAISQLLYSKIKRLLIPTWIWGVLYSILFIDSFSFRNTIYGIGHLWFLPMLFFCFILQKILIEKLQIPLVRNLILFSLLIFPFPELPFHINNSFYYLFFFNLGILAENRTIRFPVNNIVLAVIFIISLAINIYCIGLIDDQQIVTLSQKIFRSIEYSITRGITSITGVLFYFRLSSLCVFSSGFYDKIIQCAKLTMGVYLSQEFVLRILYYHTSFCQAFGLLYPFVGFILTIVISVFISYLLNNQITKSLVGL